MIMKPRLRKFALTVHVASSVGWLGAVVGFLAPAVAGMTSQDVQVVRGAYLMMELIARFALIPLSLASLLTGFVQSLGTKWGLLRHYWVLFKLLINVSANIVLLMYTQTLSYLAGVAVQTNSDLRELRSPTAVIHAVAALLLLLIATTLSVSKPRGMTRYGQKKQREELARPQRALSQP